MTFPLDLTTYSASLPQDSSGATREVGYGWAPNWALTCEGWGFSGRALLQNKAVAENEIDWSVKFVRGDTAQIGGNAIFSFFAFTILQGGLLGTLLRSSLVA